MIYQEKTEQKTEVIRKITELLCINEIKPKKLK